MKILEKLENFKICIYELFYLQNPVMLMVWLMGFFLIIFQMYGMFAHRLMTLGHIVSSRHIRQFGKKKVFNMNKVIEQSGVSIMKDMIKNLEVNTKITLKLQSVIKRLRETLCSKNSRFYILNKQLT